MALICHHRPRAPRMFAAVAGASFAVLLGACLPASAAQFSAELSRRDAHGVVLHGRLSVAGEKVRIEQPNLPTGFFIIRGAAKAAYFVKPDREVFMDAQQSSLLTELLVPVDPQAPCAAWQIRARLSGSAEGGAMWRCERVGEEMLHGRAGVAYKMTSPRGKHLSGWIDAQLRFVGRVESDNGTILELANLREAAQPDSLFEFPQGFSMFDPQQLIDQMKHGDAYIDPAMDSRAEPLKPYPGPDL
jgi:hypothetical protein